MLLHCYMGVSLDTVMILAYAKTAQGGWRFWPFQLKLLFDSSDRVRSAGKKKSRVHVRNAVHLSPVFPGTHMRSEGAVDQGPACVFFVCISVFAVTAAIGFAFTASHLEEPQVTKGSCPFRSVPRCGSACPRSGPAPWARRHRPSMAGGG